MASGSSAGRPANSGSNFASDTIFSTYDEFDIHQDSFNVSRSDPVTGTNSSKDFHTTRVSRSSAFLPNDNTFSQPEESLNLEVFTMIERTMNKYTDNQMRFLEELSSRLSQLELYCYNLDKSLGEMQSDLGLQNGEANTKLKSMDKHLQEVHRSVQLLRDKQELAETQKELQLTQKESSRSQEKDKSSSTPASETENTDNTPEIHNQQLALAQPHQVAPQPAPPSTTSETSQMTSQTITQQPPYYLPPPQLPNPAAQPQPPQTSYLPADPQYRVPIPLQGKVNHQPLQSQVFPQYQQQWSQPQPQVQSQTQMTTTGPQSTHYPAYMHSQPQASSASGGSYSGYPPPNAAHMMRGPSPSSQQYVRNHRHGDLIEKLVNMGYRGDNVESVIQRLEESGQVVDFNAVLDRLNIGHSSGASQRSWK